MTERLAGRSRPLVWFIPASSDKWGTTNAHWGADFMGETAVFLTEQEAVDYVARRYRRNDPIIKREAS